MIFGKLPVWLALFFYLFFVPLLAASPIRNVDQTLAAVNEKLIWSRDVYLLATIDSPSKRVQGAMTLSKEDLEKYLDESIRIAIVEAYFKRVGNPLFNEDEAAQAFLEQFRKNAAAFGGEAKIAQEFGYKIEQVHQRVVILSRVRKFIESLGNKSEIENWLIDQTKRLTIRKF